MVLTIATQIGWQVYQKDIKTVLLYGPLKEKIYMEQPAGFVIKGKEKLVM